MSATFFCYLRFHNILGFYIHDSIPELASVKCKRYIGVICKNLWVTFFFYIFIKMAKNIQISSCGDLFEVKFSEGVQNIRTIYFFQEFLLYDKYLWLTGTKYLS